MMHLERVASLGSCLFVFLVAAACGTGEEASTDAADASTGTGSASTSTSAISSTSGDVDVAGSSGEGTVDSTSTSGASTSVSTTAPSTSGRPPEPCGPVHADETGSNALTGDMNFSFSKASYCDYDQVGRVGIPLVKTVLIPEHKLAEYDAASPEDDFKLQFNADIGKSLLDIHALLDDALADEWTPCVPAVCKASLDKLIIPDILKLGATGSPGFPNGRRLFDPAADIFLARVLLSLDDHGPEAFAILPLNPPANDVSFLSQWPFLAEPH